MDRDSAAPVEIELKLALTEAGARQLSAHAAFRLPGDAQPEKRRLATTYFDTPGRMLATQGIVLRVRRQDGQFIQTVKIKGESGVSTSRGEWEWKLEKETPDLSLLAGTPAAEPLPDDLAASLRPLFVTDINRTIWSLELEGGTVAEAALDEGRIVADGVEESVRELELELRQGTLGPLYRLALELHAEEALAVAVESKGARGYRLATGKAPSVEKAPDIALAPDISIADAFRQIIESVLGHLLVNQPAALAGAKEGIHQMRVAIRRLRAILVLFKPCLEPPTRIRFEDELRRIGRIFGQARDWDVFCTEILSKITRASATTAWPDLLKQPAERRRAAAHTEFVKECRSPAFTAVVLGLAGWAEDGRATPKLLGSGAMARPLAEVAPELLDILADKVDRRGRQLGRRSETELHALRKSLKKLRYGLDFLESLFPHKKEKHYQARCKALQQALGAINDTVMAVELAAMLAEGTHVGLAPAIGMLSKSLKRQKHDALQDLGKSWKKFTGEARFW